MHKAGSTRLAVLWTVPALVVALVLGVFSIVEFTAEKPRITLMYLARDYEKGNQKAKAAEAYNTLIQHGYQSPKLTEKAIRLNYGAGNMQQVLDIINQAYITKIEDDKELSNMYAAAQKYVKTQTAVTDIVNSVIDETSLQTALNKLHDMHSDSAYDGALLYFNEYSIASKYGLDIKAVRAYIEAGVKAAPDYTWMLPYYAQCLRMQGELDAAKEQAEKAIKADAGDAEAWHQLSIIHLMKGEKEEAVKAGEASYDLYPYVENCNDLALAYVAAGRETDARRVEEFMKSQGETISPKVELFRQGKTTLEELYYLEEASE